MRKAANVCTWNRFCNAKHARVQSDQTRFLCHVCDRGTYLNKGHLENNGFMISLHYKALVRRRVLFNFYQHSNSEIILLSEILVLNMAVFFRIVMFSSPPCTAQQPRWMTLTAVSLCRCEISSLWIMSETNKCRLETEKLNLWPFPSFSSVCAGGKGGGHPLGPSTIRNMLDTACAETIILPVHYFEMCLIVNEAKKKLYLKRPKYLIHQYSIFA